ncbi:MAG: hypothetical protein R2745_05755 [Vicinamibacterales bacterium]
MPGVRRLLALVALFVALLPARDAPAQAPRVPPPPSRFLDRLTVGDSVIVTAVDGTRVDGRVTSLSTSGFGVRRADDGGALVGDEVPFAPGGVLRIERRDSVVEGVLLGLLSGPVVTYSWLHLAGGSDSFGAIMLRGSLVLGGLGALVGAGLDAAMHEKVYVAPRRTSVGAVIRPGAVGVAVRVAY